jgi:predicted phosphodiesterase
MLYAIVSDLHANLQAWNAVLLDIRSAGVDRIICLGDIVGYGPNPREVLESVHANVNHIVLGNHDAVVCGKMNAAHFNAAARKAVEWTSGRLGPRASSFLRELPLTLSAPGFRCAHGDFSDPSAFNYVLDPEDAMRCWNSVPDPLLFVGHSHVRALHVLGESHTPRQVAPQNFVVEDGKRFIVNVGSTGQPREDSVLASYCLFDSARGSVFFRDVPFDLDAFAAAFREAGLPAQAAGFLDRDPRLAAVPIRERLDFSPPSDPEQRVKNTVEVELISDLKRRAVRWRAVALCGAAALAATVGIVAWLHVKSVRRRVDTPPPGIPLIALAAAPESNMLPAMAGNLSGAALSEYWGIRLADRERQSAGLKAGDDGPAIVIASAARLPMLLRSAAIRAEPGMSFRIECSVLRGAAFDGSLSFAAVCSGAGLPSRSFAADPNMKRKGGWLKAQRSFTVPPGTDTVEVHVMGNFAGEAVITPPALVYRGKE